MTTLKVGAIEHPTAGSLVTVNGTAPSNRNRIINGDMRIDQRATSVTADSFTVDRWKYSADVSSKATVAQDSVAPTGFSKSLKVTSSSAYSVPSGETYKLQQRIEGFNVADLGFGAAGASSLTLSFYVRSSLTGTFGGALRNSGGTRSYPFTYSISAANTWEYKTVAIAGDTSGTWDTTTGIGLEVNFGLGVGSTYSGTAGSWSGNNYISATGATSVVATNGATFYITGVQLEAGSVATPFERRSYGQELALCQRYYYRVKADATNQLFSTGYANNGSDAQISLELPVEMRIAPTAIDTSGTASHYAIAYRASLTACSAVPVLASAPGRKTVRLEMSISSGLTQGDGVQGRFNNTSGYVGVSAEL